MNTYHIRVFKTIEQVDIQILAHNKKDGKKEAIRMVKHNPKTNWRKAETTYIAINLDK
jgi:hypothetical protein